MDGCHDWMSNINQFLNVPKPMFNMTILLAGSKGLICVCLHYHGITGTVVLANLGQKSGMEMIVHTWARSSPVITQVKCQLFLTGNLPLPSDRKEKLLKTFVGNYLVSWIMG